MNHLINSIRARQSGLSEDLISLKSALERSFDENIREAGIAKPGYFNSFAPILEEYRRGEIISGYLISEEEYVDNSYLLKIPIIDVSIKDQHSGVRMYILPPYLRNKV